jgi:hypothetical protein
MPGLADPVFICSAMALFTLFRRRGIDETEAFVRTRATAP